MEKLTAARAFLLENLTIYDGTGKPPVSGDLLIAAGKILAVGEVSSSAVPGDAVRYDCSKLCAAPGFVDIHSHSDSGILLYPEAECLIRQGVTTTVGGNCGGSAAGTASWTDKDWERYTSAGLERWKGLDGFFAAVERARPAVNLAMLFGHGDVREEIVGNSGRPLTPEEKEKMKELSRRYMQQGAFGVSSGLEYVPGRFADVDELAAVSAGPGEHGGIHTSHIRNEGPQLLEAIEEAIEVARRSRVRFEVSHLKAVGKENWGKLRKVLDLLDHATRSGVDISADVYPYLASHTELAIVLPDWVLENGKTAGLELLRAGGSVRKKIAEESHIRTEKQGGWDKIVILSMQSASDRWMEGLSIADISARIGLSPQETALDILVSSSMDVSIVRHAMNEDDLEEALRHPRTCVVTDGFISVPSRGRVHPRSIGTYPRVLGHYVRERHVLTMEDAIRKMTSLPASKMGITGRGVLQEGFAADVVVFDPDSVADVSTYKDPWRWPVGIIAVFVNGRPAIWEGEMTGIRVGKVLRKRQADV